MNLQPISALTTITRSTWLLTSHSVDKSTTAASAVFHIWNIEDDMTSNRNPPSKKRAASPSKGSQTSKRLQVSSKVSRPPLSKITSQHGNALLSLPREIRDQIYTKALEQPPPTFRVDELMVIATHHSEVSIEASEPVCRGLPLWMLSSRQVLYEVLDLIARTFTFQPLKRITGPERELAGAPNSLILTNDGVRNIKLRYLNDTPKNYIRVGYLNNLFLKLINDLYLKNACLELVWGWRSVQYAWMPDRTDWFIDAWKEHWNGRFRKVKIEIKVEKDLEQMWIMGEAEKCALRLIGTGGSVSWTTLDSSDVQYYNMYRKPTLLPRYERRCVVAERKI
ncbi:unnamed protein product [Alternaria burnsii]|nr:unnamed protein product [Alternaria burnsii]